jgi:hypothetical protein
MPAIDQCEPIVITAPQKEGWRIRNRPYAAKTHENRLEYVFADLRLTHRSDARTLIVVEVKWFPDERSFWNDFYQAIGQYVVYRRALLMNDVDVPVYLSISSAIWEKFQDISVIPRVMDEIRVKMSVIDFEKAEVMLWKH